MGDEAWGRLQGAREEGIAAGCWERHRWRLMVLGLLVMVVVLVQGLGSLGGLGSVQEHHFARVGGQSWLKEERMLGFSLTYLDKRDLWILVGNT